MPLTYTTAQNSSAQSTTTSATTATGTTGDLILAILMGCGVSGCVVPAAPTGTIASGWTAVDSGAIGNGSRGSSKAYWATAASTAAVTVTKANQAGSSSGLNMLVVFRIADAEIEPTTPPSNEVDTGNSFTPSSGGGTGTADGLAIDYGCQYTNAASATLTMPAGWTALAQLGTGAAPGRAVGRAAYKALTTTGNTTSGTITSSQGGTSTTWCGQMILVAPTASPVNTGQFLPFF